MRLALFIMFSAACSAGAEAPWASEEAQLLGEGRAAPPVSPTLTVGCLEQGGSTLFEVDGLACACGSRLVLHAVVQPPATLDVLESLERSANRKARAPPMAS